jgi:CRISPR-associated protein Cas1
MTGAYPPALQELVRIKDRISFVYVEHSVIHREDSSITATDTRGIVHIPAAAVSCLMLGPGTSISHQAIALLAESGTTTVWVGEGGVRYYAHGRSLSRSSRYLQAQAKLVNNKNSRLEVAKRMYAMRFPNEEISGLTMQQLRSREGMRVKQCYRMNSRDTNVPWKSRSYDPNAFEHSDLINQALSAAHATLYAIAYSVIIALGCSPALGFVHTGHDRSFVYDIADLYKAETSIPAAFRVVAAQPTDLSSAIRRTMRNVIFQEKILERSTRDIAQLLIPDEEPEKVELRVVGLWDDSGAVLPEGVNYDSFN